MRWEIVGKGENPKHKMKLISKVDRDEKLSKNDFKNIQLKRILKSEINELKSKLKELKNG